MFAISNCIMGVEGWGVEGRPVVQNIRGDMLPETVAFRHFIDI